MKVLVGISNRHIHLTKEDYIKLCGDDNIEVRNNLNQPGMFASNTVLTIKTDKASIDNVRVLGPFREYNQVEISKTDAYRLGLNPPVRTSSDIVGSSPITLIGPKGTLELSEGCIIADRHIHLTPDMKKFYHLEGKDKVNVLIGGIKGGIIFNVDLKVSDEAYFEMHLDTDDANAFMLKQGDVVDIIEE